VANRRRGEVPLVLGEDRYTLCLTLGALAELEDAFGVDDLGALAARFARGRPSSRDLLRLLAAALRGGGHDLTDADVAALPLAGGLPAVAAALAAALEAAFGAEAPDPKDPPAGRTGEVPFSPPPSPSPGTR
jgi:hypothetical protein